MRQNPSCRRRPQIISWVFQQFAAFFYYIPIEEHGRVSMISFLAHNALCLLTALNVNQMRKDIRVLKQYSLET